MIKKLLKTSSLSLLILSPVYAALDPIAHRITQSFPSSILTNGGTYKASVVFTSNFPLTMVTPLIINKSSNSSSEFSYNDECTGKRLQRNQSCVVEVYLNPTSDGAKDVKLIASYGNDRVPISLNTVATGGNTGAMVTGTFTTPLSSPLTLNTASAWKVTYTNQSQSQVTGINISVAGSPGGYQTNCGPTLDPGYPCTVEGTLTPTEQGSYTVTTNFAYAQGATVTESSTSSTNGTTGALNCYVSQGFAPQTVKNTSQTITLLCNNTSQENIYFSNSTSGSFNNVGTYTGTSTPSDNNCNSTQTSSLSPKANCQLTGTYTAPSSSGSSATISTETITYTVGISGAPQTASASTSTEIVDQINNQRTIHLVNHCNFNVWWGMVGGAVTNSNPNACPSGSTSNNGRCLYNGSAPTSGSYLLTSNGGTATTVITQTAASTGPSDGNILWSGLISASTKCSGNSCANNDCGNNGGNSQCTAGFQQPATEAEFTFLLTDAGNLDTYDITQVNGLSIPMSMSSNQTANGYSCGTAGDTSAQSGGLKAANYSNITPPTQMYYWVSNLASCTSSNACTTSGQICGLAYSSSGNKFVKACGDFLGYWSANQICQTSPTFSSPFGDNFNCDLSLTTPFPNNTYTLTQLLKCSPPNSTQPLFNSCYGTYAGASATALQQCCGCTNWDSIATPSESCPVGQIDPQWVTNVLPSITWMKRANPTGYSYPYDDEASTFKCTADEDTEYTIQFCPDQATALPSGATDGRD